MKGPYGLELNDGCKNCKRKSDGFFCQLSPAAVKDFDAIKTTSVYPKGALLFMEKQDARGVFVLDQRDGAGHGAGIARQHAFGQRRRHERDSSWRAMTSRWISLVPSPMVVSLTSRKYFSAG